MPHVVDVGVGAVLRCGYPGGQCAGDMGRGAVRSGRKAGWAGMAVKVWV